MGRAATTLAAAVLCLPATACGGDDKPTASDGRLTKAEYAQRMQGLVGRVMRTDDAAERNGHEAELRAAIASFNTVPKQLRALNPPAAVRRAHRDYAEAFDAFAGARLATLRAALRGDRERARRLRRQNPPDAVRDQVLRARRVFAQQGIDIIPPS